MDTLLAKKADQASDILRKQDIDMWMIVARESACSQDPSMPLVVGEDVVWTSFFIFTASGKRIALVGNFDEQIFKQLGHFNEVLNYTKGVREDLLKVLRRLHPKKIAVNYSLDYYMADGIGHGLFIQLMNMLRGTPFEGMLVSSENLLAELRAVKLPEEIERVKTACDYSERLFGSICRNVKPGMTGVDIFEFLNKKMKVKDLQPAFPPMVNIGAKSPLGHSMYKDDLLEKGELLHLDYGVMYEGYCSDIQRVLYVLKDHEKEPPEEVQKAFDTVFEIIRTVAKKAIPGTPGFKLDQIARDMLTEAGYPEYQHALGHQLGRFVHDGGAIIAPRWERYGKGPYNPIQEGNIFTLELEILVEKIGYLGLEEDIVVTPKGGKFLSKQQRRIFCV